MGSLFEPDVQDTTQRVELPPWMNQYGEWLTGAAQDMSNRPYVPYEGNRFAPLNQSQQSALGSYDVWGNMGLPALGGSFNALTDLTGAGMMGNAYAGLMGFGNNMMDYSPSHVSAGQVDPMFAQGNTAEAMLANRGMIQDVMGGSFLDMDIGDYMNPYTQQVIQNTTNEMERGRLMQMNQGEAAANAAAAFGGSRHGVADSLSNAEYFRNQGNMADQMNQAAYNAATGLMGQDLGRALQANLANQGMDWNVQNLNANLGTNTNQFNAGQLNQMGMFNAGQGNQVNLQNVANQLTAGLANQQADQNANQFQNSLMLQALQSAGGLGNQMANFTQNQGMNLMGFGQNALGGQMNAGNFMQNFGQQQLDEQYRQWLEARDWQANNFGQFGGMGAGAQGNTSTVGQAFGPSKGSQMVGMGAAIAPMFMGMPPGVGGVPGNPWGIT